MSVARMDSEYFSPRPQLEVVSGSGERLTATVTEIIDDMLCHYEQFAPDSKLYQTVSICLIELCEGEDFAKPELVVVHDEDYALTAFSTPGYLVIGSSTVKVQKYREEVSGILAHELTHETREHVKKGQSKTGLYEHTGHVRVSEAEADMRPIELLDRKNINPWGMISMFNRLEAATERAKRKAADRGEYLPPRTAQPKRPRTDDYEHGNISDRRVNLEEMLRIADVRTLSPTALTPLGLEAADFNGYQKDDELLAKYELLDDDSKRRLIIRQISSNQISTEIKRQDLRSKAKQLISEAAPDLEEMDCQVAAHLIEHSKPMSRRASKAAVADPVYSGYGETPDTVANRLQRVLSHPSLRRQHFVKVDEVSALTSARLMEQSITRHNQLPAAGNYVSLVDLFTESGSSVNLLWWPAVNYICVQPASEIAQHYTAAIADHHPSSVYMIDPFPTLDNLMSNSRDQIIGPENSDDLSEEIRFLQSRAAQRRISYAVQEPADVVELLQTAASFGASANNIYASLRFAPGRGSPTVEYDRYGTEFHESAAENREKQVEHLREILDPIEAERAINALYEENPEAVLELGLPNDIVKRIHEELSDMSPRELMDLIRFHRREGVLQAVTTPAFADVLWQEIHRLTNITDSNESRETNTAEAILDRSTFSERLTLAGLLADKAAILQFINKELGKENELLAIKLNDNPGNWRSVTTRFKQHLQAVFEADKTVAELGFETGWQIRPEDLAGVPAAQAMALRLVGTLIQHEQFDSALAIAELVPLPPLDHDYGWDALTIWDKNIKTLLKKSSDDPQVLALLACLATITPELNARLSTPSLAIEAFVRNLPFESAVEFVANGLPSLPRYHFLGALNGLIEDRSSTPEEMHLLSETIGNRLLEFLDEAAPTIGKLSLVDGILLPNYGQLEKYNRQVGIKHDKILGLEATQLLVAMLSTARSDENLSRYMLERWWSIMRTARQNSFEIATAILPEDDDNPAGVDEVAEAFRVEDITWLRGKSKLLKREHWISTLPISLPGYTSLQEAVEKAFTSNTGTKYYYLRKLLLDESYGVLHSPKQRHELIEQFLVNWLDNPDDEAAGFVRQSLKSLTRVTNPEILYQHLYPLLIDIILLPPEQRTAYQTLAYQQADAVFEDLMVRGLFGNMTSESAEGTVTRAALREKIHGLITGESQLQYELEGDIERRVLARFIKEIIEAQAAPAEVQDGLRMRIRLQINEAVKAERRRIAKRQNTGELGTSASQALLSFFSPETGITTERNRLTALDLLFTLGERSGALGTRMLQLGGMYFDMPEEQREKFAHVYDNTKGQTRLQAWRTLQREATYSPAIAEMLENLAELKPRIGGGSLMTVYEAVMKDGSREALAVKNPNVEYHLAKMVVVLDAMLEDLEAKRADEKRIGLVRSLLEDVVQWINDELTDPDFEIKDEQFRLWHSFREDLSQYRPTKNRYKLLVPRSKPTGTRWIRRDEMIDGKNINKLKIVNEPTNIAEDKISRDDFQDVISLLVHNFVSQLTEHGLVHSDVHPGNFTITDDNEALAVFDRYNLLPCNEDERHLFRRVLRTVAMGNTADGLNEMTGYILALPENNQADLVSARQAIERAAQGSSELTETGPRVLLALKQNGIRVPIKYTLVMKNILSLQRLSKKARFNGIADAYLTSADPAEIMRLLN